MKNIKDLKEQILSKTAGNLFIFNGTEWAIKKHYIDKLSEDYQSIRYVDDTIDLSNNVSVQGLFKRKTLYIVPHDLEFLKGSTKDFESIIRKMKNNDNGAIWIYTTTLPKQFITHFNDYITDFEEVEEDIFEELINHDISLMPNNIKELCKNCKRNYGMALMELDKIKNYAEYQNVSYDIAFEDLSRNNMLVTEKDVFDCKEFMNSLLCGDTKGLSINLKRLYDYDFENVWYNLEEMIQDLKIAYCIKRYGKWEGSTIAYESKKLHWGRIKEIREYDIVLEPETIQSLIMNLSRHDCLVKQGIISNKEVIENIFYYYI